MTLAICNKLQVQLPVSDWAVFIPDHHEGYLPLDVFETNQQRLRSNWRARRGDAGGRGA